MAVLAGEADVGMVVRACMVLALCVAAAAPSHAQTPAVEVSIVSIDPPRTYLLPRGELLSALVRYKSDVPLRFQAEGRWHTRTEPASMLNPAPVYPAGEGEAIVWIAYRRPASVDEIVVNVWDERWKPLAEVRKPVVIDWSEREGSRARADWVMRLNAEQQDMAMRGASKSEGTGPGIYALILPAAMLGYFFVQPWAIKRLDGGWCMAAYVPLALTIPLGLHAIIAYMAGSNLWPLFLIFGLPLATLYLLILVGVRELLRAK